MFKTLADDIQAVVERDPAARSKLEVMLGRQSADEIRLPYRDFVKDGVEFLII